MCFAYLFEELKLCGILKKLSHCVGFVCDKRILIKCNWLVLKAEMHGGHMYWLHEILMLSPKLTVYSHRDTQTCTISILSM